MSRVLDFHDGLRVRHWVDHNSVKVYNEHNVPRIETTINMPDMFRVYRRAQGQPTAIPFGLDTHKYGCRVVGMKTTLDIDDGVLIRAKQQAAAERRPLRAYVEEALREQLGRKERAVLEGRVKWVTAKGGVPDAVADRETMYDWLERNS